MTYIFFFTQSDYKYEEEIRWNTFLRMYILFSSFTYIYHDHCNHFSNHKLHEIKLHEQYLLIVYEIYKL